MATLMLFTDGSVNTCTKTGFGAYLSTFDIHTSLDVLKKNVQLKKFVQTSSTKLELQTLLWALTEVDNNKKIIVYTDCQNILALPGRRFRLEKNNYFSKNNKRLNNYELYQVFYEMMDRLDCEFIKLAGHKLKNQKDTIDKIFTLVDRASRDAMRKEKPE